MHTARLRSFKDTRLATTRSFQTARPPIFVIILPNTHYTEKSDFKRYPFSAWECAPRVNAKHFSLLFNACIDGVKSTMGTNTARTTLSIFNIIDFVSPSINFFAHDTCNLLEIIKIIIQDERMQL